MGVDSAALIKTLNQTCLNALQSAAGLCLSRTNPSVEVEHWLVKLVELPDGDLTRIFRHFEVDTSRLLRDLTKVIDGFRTGNQRTPTLSLKLEQLIRAAWVTASIQYQARQIRSGILLLALLDDEELGRLARNASAELAKIKGDLFQPNLMKLVAGSPEDTGPAATEVGSSARPGQQPAAVTQTPALEQFTINLTERAKKGQIDPVIGREAEVRQIVDILIRRRQNNPILTGEAGVGKTAVVEGLARRIAERDVPPPLKNVVVRTLDLGLLQAGAGVKGEFENRLKQVIAEVKGSPVPIILFIDEDDRDRRSLHFGDHLLEPVLELSLDSGPGLEQAEVEGTQDDILQRRGNVSLGDPPRQTLDDCGLANARLARKDRVVLAAADQDVDDLADLGLSADDRVDLAFLRSLGQVDGELFQGRSLGHGGRLLTRAGGRAHLGRRGTRVFG